MLGISSLGCAELLGFETHEPEPVCGDGEIEGTEACDDKNKAAGDGCDAFCTVETGFSCKGEPSACSSLCGDKLVALPVEGCDDGNTFEGDGCAAGCSIEHGYQCSGAPSICKTECGDGLSAAVEGCDDKNTAGGDGCDANCSVEMGFNCVGEPSFCAAVCGDGAIIPGFESCDDSNAAAGDGCSDTCAVESGYQCLGEPSACTVVCGDGIVVAEHEGCDDANLLDGDGCSGACAVEEGFSCMSEPSVCEAICGDAFVVWGTEGCDDGNTLDGDGCGGSCTAEMGYACSGEPSQCLPVCGDGFIVSGLEGCDDGGTINLDGCDSQCNVEFGYTCAGAPSQCASTCGDGKIAQGSEQCDDSNVQNNDCCSAQCLLEFPDCEIEPNNIIMEANDFDLISSMNVMRGYLKPASEKDFFQFSVPPFSVANISVETIDGPSTTCASNMLDTRLSVYDGQGNFIASDDNGGAGLCSLISFVNLAAGNYFAEVSAGAPLSADYRLSITKTIYQCGNGIKEGPEQCDDGNTVSGDSCSSSCQFEFTAEDEAGGNNTCADPNGPFPAPVLLTAAITPVGDADYFSFTLATTSDVRVETFGPSGPGSCPAGVDTNIVLSNSDCSLILASDNDDGLGTCSLINPFAPTDSGARHLAPGTYTVRVEEFGNNAQIMPGYMAYIMITAECGNGVEEGFEECDDVALPSALCDIHCDRIPICGDMFIDAPEVCDDGNALNGDGCSSACQFENVGLEMEPNNTTAAADASPVKITGDGYISGSINPIGDVDVFRFDLAQGSVVRFEIFDGSMVDCNAAMNTTLRIKNAGGMILYEDSGSGIGDCSALVIPLPPGTYYTEVLDFGSNAIINNYALEIDIQGNVGNEIEGNDSFIVATPFAGSDVIISGNHQVNSDADWYMINVPNGWSLRAEIVEGGAETCESGEVDSLLSLHDASGLQIASDDDQGRGFCSLLDGTGNSPLYTGPHALSGGTYYLRVGASNGAQMGTAGQFNYRLALTMRSP